MNIFKYIENISYKLGLRVANHFHEDSDGIEETQYGMFAILSFLFEFGTGFIISLIFGYVKYFLVFQITYCFLRSVCGGEHCKTFAIVAKSFIIIRPPHKNSRTIIFMSFKNYYPR
jgi:accessory gene regulator protein AgrB